MNSLRGKSIQLGWTDENYQLLFLRLTQHSVNVVKLQHIKRNFKICSTNSTSPTSWHKFWVSTGKIQLCSPGWVFSLLVMNGTIRVTKLTSVSIRSLTHVSTQQIPLSQAVFAEPQSVDFSLINSCQEFTALLIA